MITKLFPVPCNVYARGPVGENVMHVAMLLNTPSTLAITRYLVKLYGRQLVNCPIQVRGEPQAVNAIVTLQQRRNVVCQITPGCCRWCATTKLLCTAGCGGFGVLWVAAGQLLPAGAWRELGLLSRRHAQACTGGCIMRSCVWAAAGPLPRTGAHYCRHAAVGIIAAVALWGVDAVQLYLQLHCLYTTTRQQLHGVNCNMTPGTGVCAPVWSC
jgi:hypothetical protein